MAHIGVHENELRRRWKDITDARCTMWDSLPTEYTNTHQNLLESRKCLNAWPSKRKPGSGKVRRNLVLHDDFLWVLYGALRLSHGSVQDLHGLESGNLILLPDTRILAPNAHKPGSFRIPCF